MKKGTNHTKETKRKIREKSLKQFINGMPMETRIKISDKMNIVEEKEKRIRKIRKALARVDVKEKMLGNKNPMTRPEVIKKRRETIQKPEIREKLKKPKSEKHKQKLREIKLKNPVKFFGEKNPAKRADVRKKLREASIKYIKEVRGNISPNIGHNEKQILDEIELSLGYKIIRQFETEGYFTDGYIPELNLVIEIDEKFHHNQKKRDIERQKIIEKELNCNFMRINNF